MSATTLNGDINESQVKNNCDSTDLFSKLVRIVEEDGQICTPLEEPKVNSFIITQKFVTIFSYNLS